ncbi:MAG: tetratricopeptide repeat protein, partial [Deltaproteobacteria bacterium]|nr:tetratricopeptide repeat protein [Deltaproteobacteria bacterium]
MNQQQINTCARCGVPVKPGVDLCNVCAADATARKSVVPCLACGAVNPSTTYACESCGAPLKPMMAAEEPEETTGVTSTWIMARRAELQVLEDCFDLALERGRVGGTIITGDTGMGVSTLLDAFAERLTGRLPLYRIFYVQCRGDEEMYGPWRHILRQRFEATEEEDPRATRLKFTKQVGKVMGSDSAALVTETAHLIGHVAGLPFPESPVLRALESDEMLLHKRVKEAIVRFIEADAAEGPIAMIIDSLHQASSEALTFMMEVFESLGRVPVIVAVGGLPAINDITDNPAVVRVNLEPLDDELMRSMFYSFMPLLHDPPEDLVEATVGRASGNPGSLRELCALLTETGVVDTSTETWTADVSKLSMADMPVNMDDALKARISRLDKRDRQVLEAAAVVGEVFWDEGVLALIRQHTKLKDNIGAAQIWADDSDGFTISSSLDRLVERQFVAQLPERDIEGSLKFAFARSGIRDSILAEMDSEDLPRTHYLAALWLAQAPKTHDAAFAEEEAAHWEAAGRNDRASSAYLRAARYARTSYLNQKAIKLFEKGIGLTDEQDRLVLADALHDLGSVHELLGKYEAAELYYTEMLRNAWIITHRGKAGAALNKIGRLYRSRSDTTAARAFLERAMSLFKAAGDEKGVAACLGDLGELARRQGSYDRAFRLVSQALELQRKMDNQPSIAVCLHSLGHIEAARAAYSQGERYLEEALEIRRGSNDKGGMAQTLSALAIVLFNRGDLEKAIARWEAALALTEEVGDRRMLAIVHNNLGEAFRDQGKLVESMQHFKTCEEVVTKLDDRL